MDGLSTLDLLGDRLQRLEFYLTGSSDLKGAPLVAKRPATHKDDVFARMATLEKNIQRLSSQNELVQEVLRLHYRYPDLFTRIPESEVPSLLDPRTISSIVLAHTTAFPETASRLTALKDLPIPPASESAQMIELQPRLDRVLREQDDQAHQIAELRIRTARLLERWVALGVVVQGEVWAEWEERVKVVERGIRRMEVAREQQEQ